MNVAKYLVIGLRGFGRWGIGCALLGVATLGVTPESARAEDPSFPSLPLPKYGSSAVRLFQAHDYFRKNDAPDFWALMPYYVHQFNERACSVASTTMIVNAARAQVELNADDVLVTQRMMLKRVGYPRWMETIETGGDGVTIEDIGVYLKEALERFTEEDYEVEAVRVNPEDPGLRERVRRMLIENERSDEDFVIVVFWQATFTDDPEGETGHVAPLAAFDAEKDRALVFDPDREWYEPYWVPLDTLVAGMARRDPESGRPRGYIWCRKIR